jgi:hypothetical protein
MIMSVLIIAIGIAGFLLLLGVRRYLLTGFRSQIRQLLVELFEGRCS